MGTLRLSLIRMIRGTEKLLVYVDSDHRGCADSFWSTTGMENMLNGGPVMWVSRIRLGCWMFFGRRSGEEAGPSVFAVVADGCARRVGVESAGPCDPIGGMRHGRMGVERAGSLFLSQNLSGLVTCDLGGSAKCKRY